jgi:ATP-dependent DNA helicase RecG
MRPEILFPAFKPVNSLKGCGPHLAAAFKRLAIERAVDLWWHLPTGIVDRRFMPTVAAAPIGEICTLTLTVVHHQPPRSDRLPYRIACCDETGDIQLAWFRGRETYLRDLLPEGSIRVVSGRIEEYQDSKQILHPDLVVKPEELQNLPLLEPVYPLTAGLSQKVVVKLTGQALALAPVMPEWLDPALQKQRNWPAWKEALALAHRPPEPEDASSAGAARSRLAYDELLASQLALLMVRAHARRGAGRALVGDGRLRRKVVETLPYALTGAQTQAMAEIEADLASATRMQRLLQGDVGSGKTVVALLAMLVAVEAGGQAALMAPTEVLARQHYTTLSRLAAPAGIRLGLFTGRDKGRARAEQLERLAAGEIDIAIGTHALFQEDVAFRDLAFAVVDEQHRFGVHQRLLLAAKGVRENGAIDLLSMTATPIPRTLALTAYGDLDISALREKPPGRTPIDTRTVPLGRIDEVVAGVQRKIAAGERVYWICPLVEESEVVDLAAAEDRFRDLRAIMGDAVGLVHGRMKGPEKDAAMAAFAEGRTKVLVATTVVEVGVDVPEATLIVIEHAERFGLAALHQLRGRVGRGSQPGACLLLYATPLGETGRARLRIMRETDDGFRIAEEDLRLRGAGEVLGTRQSGLPAFRLADLAIHADLLAVARDDARLAFDRDPKLKSARGEALRVLLYLFERDAAIGYLGSG